MMRRSVAILGTAIIVLAVGAGTASASPGPTPGDWRQLPSTSSGVPGPAGVPGLDVVPNAQPLGPDTPAAPTGLTAAPGVGQVGLTWTAPAGSEGDPLQYEVSYGVSPAGAWTVWTLTPSTSAVVTGLAGGTTYMFRVRSKNVSFGAYSDVVTSTPVGVPAAPRLTQVVASPGAISVTWAVTSDGGSPITSFTLSATPAGGAAQTLTIPDGAARSATIALVTSGPHAVALTATNAVGTSAPAGWSAIDVPAVEQNVALNATTFYPYRDGYLDVVTATAASNVATSGELRVLGPTGARIRTWPLSQGNFWQVAWNGTDARGVRVPNGRYRIALLLVRNGTLSEVASRTVAAALSQAVARLTRSTATVYPVRDGYLDAVTFTAGSGVPATGTLTLRKGRVVVASWRLVRARNWTRVWNGTWLQRIVPGAYTAALTVRGGEGVARSAATTVVVSPKRLVATPFLILADAKVLARGALSGHVTIGPRPWSVALWSGTSSDEIVLFSVTLPAAVKYGPTMVYSCTQDSWGDGREADMAYLDRAGRVSSLGHGMGDVPGCYYHDAAPGSYVAGRSLRWVIGYFERNDTWYYIDGFKIRGTAYVLR